MIRALQDRVLTCLFILLAAPKPGCLATDPLPGRRRDLSPTISPMKENLK